MRTRSAVRRLLHHGSVCAFGGKKHIACTFYSNIMTVLWICAELSFDGVTRLLRFYTIQIHIVQKVIDNRAKTTLCTWWNPPEITLDSLNSRFTLKIIFSKTLLTWLVKSVVLALTRLPFLKFLFKSYRLKKKKKKSEEFGKFKSLCVSKSQWNVVSS